MPLPLSNKAYTNALLRQSSTYPNKRMMTMLRLPHRKKAPLLAAALLKAITTCVQWRAQKIFSLVGICKVLLARGGQSGLNRTQVSA